jgi:hypothetical protein
MQRQPEEERMKKLLRMLALVSALSVTSIAAAGYYDPGKCYITCSDGVTTAGPYWSTAESCCADFQALCGGYGTAYTEYFADSPSFRYRVYCLES